MSKWIEQFIPRGPIKKESSDKLEMGQDSRSTKWPIGFTLSKVKSNTRERGEDILTYPPKR